MLRYGLTTIESMNVASDNYMGELLHSMRDSNFLFQEDLQLDSVIIERRNLPISKFKRSIRQVNGKFTARYKYTAYVDYQFINPQRKLALKRSGLLGKELTFYDISNNPSIFDKNYMIFIDGELVDCVNILVGDAGVEFVLNVQQDKKQVGVPYKQYKEWLSRDVRVDVLFFSNSKFNPIETDRETLQKNHQFFSYTNEDFINSLNDEDSYATFILFKEEGYRSDLLHVQGKEKLLKYFQGLNVIKKKEKAFINVYGFKNLNRMIEIKGNERVFQLPGYKMPIPVENIIPFRKTEYGNKYAGDITFRRHFPNFYEIKGNTDGSDLSLLVFYSQDNYKCEEYYNEISSYYKIMGDDVETFTNAPMAIQRYSPLPIQFSIKDFLSSGSKRTPLGYKLSVLNTLVDKNPEYLRQFVKDRTETSSGFYIRLKNIDLESRKRTSNKDEVAHGFLPRTFKEERYVVTMRDLYGKGKFTVRFYVDGLLYVPDEIHNDGQYTYMYIPTTMVNKNSIIEVEQIVKGKVMSYTQSFSTLSTVAKLNVPIDAYSLSDIIVVDAVTGEELDRRLFNFTTTYNGMAINHARDIYENFKVNNVRVMTLSDTMLNRSIKFVLSKETQTSDTIYEERSYGVRHTVDMTMEGVFNQRRLRLFKNGRLIPSYNASYEVKDSEKNIAVNIEVGMKRGDKFHVDYLPTDYLMILELYRIPNNGVLNLKGLIDRPFDLEWHDVYVNGVRMTKDNFEFVSPFIIKLKNTKSFYNLTIYEKGRQLDVITLSDSARTVIDKIWEEDEAFRDALVDFDTNTSDDERDILTESIYWYVEEMKEFFYNEMENTYGIYHINPDIDQIAAETRSKYPRLFRKNPSVLHLNGDIGKGKEETIALHINPDSARPSRESDEVEEMYLRFMLLAGLHVNPDLDQITPEMRASFKHLFGEDNGFFINPDFIFETGETKTFVLNPDSTTE